MTHYRRSAPPETDHGLTATLETAGKSFRTAITNTTNLPALRGTRSETRTLLDGLADRLETAEGRTTEAEKGATEIIQSEEHRRFIISLTRVTGVQKAKNREWGRKKKTFEKIMT